MTTANDARAFALLPLLGAIASQVAFVTGVLYYFGWAYSWAFFGHFGVPAGMLGFTTQDYVLLSVGAMFLPLLSTLFGILALLAVRKIPVWHALKSGRPRTTLRWWAGLSAAAGTLLIAVVAVITSRPTPLAAPLKDEAPFLLIAGAATLGYASWLLWRYPAVLGIRRPKRTVMQVRTLALVAVAMIGYTWAVADFAVRKGQSEAVHQETVHFVDRPSIVVFSVDRLGIEGPGTQAGEISAPNEKYRYVYSGLWLLARTSDRYYLLPQQWQFKRDRVFVIKDSESVRIDIARNPWPSVSTSGGRPAQADIEVSSARESEYGATGLSCRAVGMRRVSVVGPVNSRRPVRRACSTGIRPSHTWYSELTSERMVTSTG